MGERKYPQETLEAIRNREYVIEEDGLPILVKPIPETDEAGVLDPRLYEGMAPMLKGVKGFAAKQVMKAGSRNKGDVMKSAKQMRQMMDGVKSIPIVDSVEVSEESVPCGDIMVPIRIYTPKRKTEGLKPVFYYIHGGGFVAGSMDVVDEMCRLVVENTGCVAVQPGYRLAPENPYPAGLDDCYAVLKWIASNIARFEGDPERICISGDSAGGNLAAVCAMRDRDDGTHLVKAQALLYPSVDAAHMPANLEANKKVYEISKRHRPVLNAMFDMMENSLCTPTLGEYLKAPDDTHPYISPSLGNLEHLPPCIILLGEYDFLRVEDDTFAHKLQKAGVTVKLVRYKGLSHGFADQVGVTPQAEDALRTIGAFMLQYLG